MTLEIGLGFEWKDPLKLLGDKAPETPKVDTSSTAARATAAARPAFSDEERNTLVNTLIAEAAGEGTDGMKAVAAVIKNRSQERGKSPLDIVKEPDQFTGYSKPGAEAVKAMKDPVLRKEAESVLDGVFSGSIQDPTGGADHYHADYVNPSWASKMQKTGQIGRHLFYKSGEPGAPAPSSTAAAFAPGLGQQQEDPFTKILRDGSDKPADADNPWLRYANQGATRNLPLNQKLVGSLGFLPEMGVTMEVFSGGQPTKAEGGPRTGSERHDHGEAADVFFYKDGRRLDWSNPDDVPVFQEIVRRGKENGITGFGAGDGYMRPGSMHLGFGKPAVWGAGGKGTNAPDWLRSAYAGAPSSVTAYTDEPATPTMAEKAPKGLLEPGNIDLTKRPIVRNDDGSISTVRSMSFEMDGKEVLIPTVSPDGKILSDNDAIALYKRTGQHLGMFDNANDATTYAQKLHEQQAGFYAKAPGGAGDGKAITVDANFTPQDPMGLFSGHNPFARTATDGSTVDPAQQQAAASAQAEQNRMNAYNQQHNAAVDQQAQRLGASDPGRYQAINEDELAAWTQQWKDKNQSKGIAGDTDRMFAQGVFNMGSSLENLRRMVFNKIPVVGPKLNELNDAIDRWTYGGKTRGELLARESERMQATVSDGQKAADSKRWTETVEYKDGAGNPRKTLRMGPAFLDPRSYLGMAVRSAPETLATMAPGGIMARGAYVTKIAAGMTEREAAAAAAKTATIAGSAFEGVFGGADSALSVRDQITKLPPDVIQSSDAYKAAIAGGMTPDQAIENIASNAETQAFLLAGVATGIFGGMGDRALAKIVSEGVNGGFARRTATGIAKGVVSEGVFEEAPQSALSQISENVSMQKADPRRGAFDDVAEQTVGGLVGGGLMGGAFGGVGGAASRAEEHAAPPEPEATAQPAPAPAPAPQPKGPLGRAVQHAEDKLAGRQQRDAAAAVAGMPAKGTTVRVDHEGVDPFMGRVEGHEGDEVIVSDTGSGEIYQVPSSSVKQIADSAENIEAAKPKDTGPQPINDALPDFSNDPALEPAAPRSSETTSEPIPDRAGTHPALDRIQGRPQAGQRVIVDDGKSNRFAAKIQSYEEGGTEALVKNDAGEELQVPVTALHVDKSTPKQVEAEELKRNPPVEREVGEAGPNSRKTFGKTVVFPDANHAALYDLAKDRNIAKKVGGAQFTDLERVSNDEAERLATIFKMAKEDLLSMADHYRYQADDAGRSAKSSLPQKLPPVDQRRLRQWQNKFAKANGTAIENADDLSHWWDVELTHVGRRKVLEAAGVKRPDKVMWQHLTPKVQQQLAAMRGAENGEIPAAADTVAENTDAVDASADSAAKTEDAVAAPSDTGTASKTDEAAHEAATSPNNDHPEPTQAQKEAGNYKVGRVSIGGLDISIENPEGSERKGVDPNGKPWSIKMQSHYGYIRGTVGKDKDHIDVFVKPGTDELSDSAPAFVIDQRSANGKFDEHKVMLGFANEAEARKAYMANYTKGWRGLGDITETTLDDFKGWLAQGDTAKPFAPKWFTTAEKAEAFIAKNGLQPTHEIRNQNRRFEIVPRKGAELTPASPDVAEPVEAPKAGAALPNATAPEHVQVIEQAPAAALSAQKAPKARKPKAPKLLDRLENYFQPGRRVPSYAGTDEIIRFNRGEGGNWTVEVAEVKKDGSLDRPRIHSTAPNERELAKWERENPVGAAPHDRAGSTTVSQPELDTVALAEHTDEEQGPFGPVLRGYEGNWKDAALELERRQSGDAIGALHHPEVGPIDLVWGKEGNNKHDGYGLAKLIAWHPEALKDLQGMLDGMNVVSRSDNRIMLGRADKDKAAVRLDWDGKAKAWLISAYEMGRRRSERSTLRLADIWEDASSSPPPDANIADDAKNVEGAATVEGDPRSAESSSSRPDDLLGDRRPAPSQPSEDGNEDQSAPGVDETRRSGRSTDRPTGRQEDASSPSPPDAGSGATTDTATAKFPDDTASQETGIAGTMARQGDQVERPQKRPDAKGSPTARDLKTMPVPERAEGTPILQWAKKSLLSLGRKSGHEYLIAVDDDGSVVASGTASKRQRTGMSDELYAALANPDRKLVVFHNHPENSPVSLEDISMLPMPGLYSIWSIGHGGRDTRIELTDAARAQVSARGEDPRFEVQRIMRSIAPARQRLKSYLQRLVNKRAISPEEAQMANEHLPALIAERAGILGFETSSPYDPGFVPGLSKQIDGAAAAVAEDFFDGRNRGNPVGRSGGPAGRIRHIAEMGRMEGRGQDVAGSDDGSEGLSSRGGEDDSGEAEFWEGVNRQFAPVKATKANIVSAIGDAINGKFTDAQPALLATVPLNYFPELAHGHIPAIDDYLGLKRQMDAYRGEKHDAAVQIIDRWRSFMAKGFVGIDRQRADQLADLMHSSTLAGIDPSETSEEESSKPGYATLRKQFSELPPKGREVFTQVRDAYRQQAEETDQLLLEHVKKAQQIALAKAEANHREAMADLAAQDLSPIDRRMKTEELKSKYKAESTRSEWAAKARLTKLRQQFESSRVPAPYFPLARFGRYFVVARDIDGTVLHFSRHENKADMANALRELKGELPNAEFSSGVLEEAGEARNAMDPRIVAEMDTLLVNSGVDPSVRDALYQRYLETMPDLSMRKRFIHRKGTAGYNRDAFRVFASTQFHAAHQMARLKFGLDLQESVNRAVEQAKSLGENTREMTLVNEFKKRDAWVRNPTGAAFTNWLTSAAYVWYMGASPAAALVNASQTWMVGVPLLGAKFGIARSAAALAAASKDFLAGKGDVRRTGLSKDERAAMDAFYKSGLIDRTQSHDLAAVGETGTKYNPIRAKVMRVLSWGFHNVEVANREITALAAYRLARNSGQDVDQAVATAHERTYAIHFDMSNSSRPRIMQRDEFKIALMFRAYQINMLYRLFRDAHQAFQGESRQVRREAQVQLAGSVGMMSLMAGMTGTAGYGFIMAAAEIFKDIFGDDDDPMTIEDRFKAGVVETLGPELGGMVLNGVPGHLLGIDLTSRIGMPDLWFRSSGRDLSGKEWWQEYVFGAAGAGVGMIGDMIEGYKVMTDGDSVARGIEVMAPKAVRDVMKMWRYAHEGVKSRNGDEVLPADEVGWADVAKQFIGFTPAKIAEVYDRNSSLKNAEAKIRDERRRVMNQFASAVEAKDPEARQNALAEVRRFNMAPSHVSVRITSDALKQSLKTRARNRAKRVGGALIQNEGLGAQLRKQLAEPVYR